MPLVFFAHSTSSDNEAGIRSGWADPPLSDRGRSQARALGAAVAETFDLVYTSDLMRARQTAAIAFPDAPKMALPNLREMHYGDLNSAPDAAFPLDPEACITRRYPSGECCLDVEERVRRFLKEHVQEDASVAVVAHKYPQLALKVILNEVSWEAAIATDWRNSGSWQPGWTYATRRLPD